MLLLRVWNSNLTLSPRNRPFFTAARASAKKGPLPGQASYYYSFTDLKTSGYIKRPGMTSQVSVTGVSWFDQEFGSNQLSGDQEGWDWFALHLSDGRDLMIYKLRKKDGSIEKESSGTIVERDGTSRQIALSEIETKVLAILEEQKDRGKISGRLAYPHSISRSRCHDKTSCCRSGTGEYRIGRHYLLGRRGKWDGYIQRQSSQR